jgi:membrane protein DedA with SNARE-associated domain
LAWAVSVAILVVLAGLAQRPSDATLLLNAASAAKWAPWWIYLIVILGGNYLRQALIPSDALPEWDVVVVVLAISAALFAAVTALYRILHRSKTSAQSSA